jgi:predicted metal-binding protein
MLEKLDIQEWTTHLSLTSYKNQVKMDKRLKCRTWNCETYGMKQKCFRTLDWVNISPKAQQTDEQTKKFLLFIINSKDKDWRTASSSRVTALQAQGLEFKPQSHQKRKKENQENLQHGRIYIEVIHLTENCYPEHIRNS